ncbi:VOC family protein [Massilia violaceinigra]|uniref:VOC family protein n=1 Tax=Massilia violaceinigra TaxID=2045208 RepID=A0ABY4A432_9BURK|nr:VOC family protein [Massilia violaceinigra]UOD28920.1 VOC family protein [Massilia violaceinigra]
MPACQLDHITVTAPTLAQGAAWIENKLGVAAAPGGKHSAMGTHNLLLRLGEALFLEIIAIDPDAPPPGRARWFALDTLGADAPPALSAWVARTGDIALAAEAAGPLAALGAITPMGRGAPNWLITIPGDGNLPLGGVGPALIEWEAGPHPAAGMADLGLSLARLELFHPEPQRVGALLDAIGMHAPVTVVQIDAGARPYLRAHIDTPAGPRIL